MLTSQVIFLKHLEGNEEHIKGNHIHGLFFKEILGSQNPKIADALHHPGSPNPFSLGYLSRSGSQYRFRIASWLNEIAEAVFGYFNSHSRIIIGDCMFGLIKTSTDNRESPWAMRIDPDDFIRTCDSTVCDTFRLEHCSPTSFKSGNSHLPLPVPEYIIRSLYRSSPDMLKSTRMSLPELLDAVQLKQHRIRSVYNRRNHGSIASFIGETEWHISKKAAPEQKAMLWRLFNFSFYAGIGVKTTQGMGMCRITRPNAGGRSKLRER